MLIAIVLLPHGWMLLSVLALLGGIALAPIGLTSGRVRTFTASAAAMGKGLAVVGDATYGEVDIAGLNAAAIGFVDEANLNAGDPIGIVMEGECYMQIGAAITAYGWLKTDASGRVIPATATGDVVVGMALCAGVNANDFIVGRVVRFIHP